MRLKLDRDVRKVALLHARHADIALHLIIVLRCSQPILHNRGSVILSNSSFTKTINSAAYELWK